MTSRAIYFSSGPDFYMSVYGADATFGPRTAVSELDSAASDLRPSVRKGVAGRRAQGHFATDASRQQW